VRHLYWFRLSMSLIDLGTAIESHDRPAALAIHVDLLTKGSQTDDIGLWMSGIKQLIMRL
jgi:protein transport protein SEC31